MWSWVSRAQEFGKVNSLNHKNRDVTTGDLICPEVQGGVEMYLKDTLSVPGSREEVGIPKGGSICSLAQTWC